MSVSPEEIRMRTRGAYACNSPGQHNLRFVLVSQTVIFLNESSFHVLEVTKGTFCAGQSSLAAHFFELLKSFEKPDIAENDSAHISIWFSPKAK